MLDYQYSRTEGLIEVIKSRNGDRLCAALLEEESTFSMHVFRYDEGRIVMDERKTLTEAEFADEFEVRYWIIR